MTDVAKRPNRLPWPPIIYVAAIAIAILLGIAYPLPWIGPPLSEILFAAGFLVIAGVVAIDVAAMRAMRRANTTIMPNKASEQLVTNGPFSFSRNPIYLANTMLMFGGGLVAGSLWFFLLGFIAAFITRKLAIEREEKHLTARFGKRYIDYAKRVRRWI